MKMTPKKNIRWEKMFQQLAAFRRKHGHCVVRQTYGADLRLIVWLGGQRHSGRVGELSGAHRQRLLDLGVVFSLKESLWDEMLAAFVAFQREYGHPFVPMLWDDPPNMGSWVGRQRKRFKQGRLEPERVRRLTKAGFEFATGDLRWGVHYDRLVQFQKKHGHCNAGPRDGFGQWLYNQRKFRREGRLNVWKIQKLDAIGFEWVQPNQREVLLAATWQQRMKELKAFKREHGHCRVPIDTLASWVRNLRTRYSQGKLSRAQIRELNKLGFVWRKNK